MRVLVVGSGGREHALAWKLVQSPGVERLFCAPGNGGTALVAENVPIPASAVDTLAIWAEERRIDLVVIGPEDPLAAGLADRLVARGIRAFGPGGQAARIESSKSWAKQLMVERGIPTARSAAFDSPDAVIAYIRAQDCPLVVKADGLAAGKGVVVAETPEEAVDAVQRMMVGRAFGNAGTRLVVEERLRGVEVSLLAVTDGQSILPLVPACDYKRVGDGDVGPNTGGMGAYAPPPWFTPALLAEVERTILRPAVEGIIARGMSYHGVLYAGLMLTAEGPKVIEFNARFGDPETQAILPLLETDLLEMVTAAAEGRLHEVALCWRPGAACCVVLASGGYPGAYATGYPIEGLDGPNHENAAETATLPDRDTVVFHAGTRREGDAVVTAGGRVLNVAARGATLAEARARAYRRAKRIRFPGVHYRRDIGLREIKDDEPMPRPPKPAFGHKELNELGKG